MFELNSYRAWINHFQEILLLPNDIRVALAKDQSRTLLKSRNYYQTILALNILDDDAFGIDSIIENNIYYRKLRTDTHRLMPRGNPKYRYAIMGLNLTLTAQKILAIEDKGFANELHQATSTFLENLFNETDPKLLQHHLGHFNEHFIEPLLQIALNTNLKTTRNRIDAARDFVPIDYHPLRTIHEFQLGDNTYFHLDNPVTTLTDKQIESYTLYKQEPWYLEQDEFTQKLIDGAVPHILNGHMISTQLKNKVPGIRNAGHELLFNAVSEKPILSAFHSGTLAQDFKQTHNTAFTKENIQQVINYFNAEHFHIVNLLTPLWILQDDKRLSAQVETAINQYKLTHLEPVLHYSNIAANISRQLLLNEKKGLRKSSAKFSGVNELLEEADALLKQMPYLYQDYNYQRVKALVNRIKRDLGDNTWLDLDNANMRIAADTRCLCSYLNRLLNRNAYIQLEACKSGKEREGITRIISFIHALELDDPTKNSFDLTARTIISMRISQKLAGLHGNNFGLDFLKPSSITAMPVRISKYKNYIFAPTANLNKSFPTLSYSQSDKLWFVGAILLSLPLSFMGVGLYFIFKLVQDLHDRAQIQSRINYELPAHLIVQEPLPEHEGPQVVL